MRAVLALCALLAVAAGSTTPAAHATPRNDTPAAAFVVEETFWLKPGRREQFISLFRKTRLPALQRALDSGQLLSLRLAQPQLQSGKEQWDYRLTLAWKDQAAALAHQQHEQAGESLRENLEIQLREELVLDRSEVLLQEETL